MKKNIFSALESSNVDVVELELIVCPPNDVIGAAHVISPAKPVGRSRARCHYLSWRSWDDFLIQAGRKRTLSHNHRKGRQLSQQLGNQYYSSCATPTGMADTVRHISTAFLTD